MIETELPKELPPAPPGYEWSSSLYPDKAGRYMTMWSLVPISPSQPDPSKMSLIAQVEQFDIDNGRDAILVDGCYLFSNGAMRDLPPTGIRRPPPSDPFERQRKIVLYHEELAAIALREFDAFKNQLRGLAKSNSISSKKSKESLQELERLKAVALEKRKLLEIAQKKLDDLTPSWMKDREKHDFAQKQEDSLFLADVNKIEL